MNGYSAGKFSTFLVSFRVQGLGIEALGLGLLGLNDCDSGFCVLRLGFRVGGHCLDKCSYSSSSRNTSPHPLTTAP